MTVLSFLPRVKQIVTTGGTGNLVLGSAASGFQAFGAGQDAQQFPYFIEDGTAWEEGTLIYTHSGTSVVRTRAASSTGSALNVNVGAFVYVGLTADLAGAIDLAMRTFITGLLLSKGTGDTVNVSAGAAYVPAAGKVIAYAGGTNLSPGTLGVSQWNQAFLSEAAAIEFTNNADPPSTPYHGNARQGGTNSNRRWLGSVRTDSSSHIVGQASVEASKGSVEVAYQGVNVYDAPQRVISNQQPGSFTMASMAAVIPRYAAVAAFINGYVTAASGGSEIDLSTDGTNRNLGSVISAWSSGGFSATLTWVPIERSTPGIYYVATAGAYIDVGSYRIVR